MEDENVGIEMDEEMEMDEPDGEGSDMEDEEEEIGEDPGSSPFQQPSSGPGSTPTSTASSPPVNDDILASYPFSGKPLSIRRGPGRPRKEGKPSSRTTKSPSLKLKKYRTGSYGRGMPKRVRSIDKGDSDAASVPQSPSEEAGLLDPETGALIMMSDKPSISEEPPYFPEQWPGKVCALCNLGERSQLGQGEMLRFSCPEGFIPRRMQPSELAEANSSIEVTEPDKENGDKSPRGGPVAVTCRRQKSFNKCRNPSMTNEYVDELTIIGHSDEPDVSGVFENDNTFYIHQSCAMWSSGILKNEVGEMSNLASVVLQSLSRKCSNCGHYGASLICKVASCTRLYHYPCATAAGAFQDSKTISMFCNQHLGQVPLFYDSTSEVTCITCYALGDVSNLMFCSSCGQHHHGACVGLAQLPGVRAGWQCRDCKVCQICRVMGDESKLMSCEQCDKAYHAQCLRPVVTSVPKYGWKCKCCRVCGDCGSRTPGAGQSSRWHAHYTVCDSCYQQRNKGFSCPLCRKAYRAHAYREMVQCNFCRRFVHPKCDPEADLVAFQHRKETNPEYEYVCLACKNLSIANRQMIVKRKDSTEDGMDSNISASQDSLNYDDPYLLDLDMAFEKGFEDGMKVIGLGKGKPYCASKIAKKRLGMPGRPKGVGKGLPGKFGHQRRRGFADFGRKRGPKSKMRGIFGVPGVGLQRPIADANTKADDEPGNENRLVLCSAKDKFVLTQDICVMCGALGTDQEGCLISCAQCGQCYHPYCVNLTKVTKVILQKGWRCLDCSICEGCGQKNDEARLILCDECDISYHIYCMDPPLDYVPTGTWKCKWCAMCQTCGSQTPGVNSNWMNSFSECGPCASLNTCPYCLESYTEGELVINCSKCDRWLHGACDSIKTENDAERCSDEGYVCILCRPKDIPPPHLIPQSIPVKPPPSPIKSPEIKPVSTAQYFVDGVYLSEMGFNTIKALSMDNQQQSTRKKRKKMLASVEKEAGIMATIESVVAGGSVDNNLQDSTAKLELVDVKEEPQEMYKEGMIWTPKTDGAPPEGFTIYTTENGVTMLRRKRQRNLQKLGIGGFLVRMRGTRPGQDNDEVDTLPGQSTSAQLDGPLSSTSASLDPDKPRRKPPRRKQKGKLAESYPVYLQEAFFGRDLLDTVKEKEPDSSSAGEEEANSKVVTEDKIIHLSQDELKAMEAVKSKQDKEEPMDTSSTSVKEDNEMVVSSTTPTNTVIPKEEDDSDSEALKDVLALPGELLDTDLVNTIMNEDNEDLAKNADTLESLADSNLGDDGDLTNTLQMSSSNPNAPSTTKDELTDILGSHFNLEIPNMNSKDVEEIFKGVLTDESQESQESMFPISSNVFSGNNTQTSNVSHPITAVRPTVLPSVGQSNLNSPMSFPSQSPYHSEYSNSPQFSPAFSEPPSPWVSAVDPPDAEGSLPAVPATSYNQRSTEKMKVDETLGSGATISAVLYANMNHPEWKTEYPHWNDRCKQILKKWRALSSDKKAPYLQQARDNRSALRMKKAQQMNKEVSSPTEATRTITSVAMTTTTVAVSSKPSTTATSTVTTSANQVEDQDKVPHHQKSIREAEQERQWKHMQAMRQQQAQQQQQVILDQRVQAMARVHRQMSDSGPQFTQDPALANQLQVSTSQETTSTPTVSPRQFIPPPMKGTRPVPIQSPTFQQPSLPPPRSDLVPVRPGALPLQRPMVRPASQPPSPFSPPSVQSPHEFQSPSSVSPSQSDSFQRPSTENLPDPYLQSPQTPRPQFTPGQQSPSGQRMTTYQPRLPSDPYAQAPGTPRSQFNTPRAQSTFIQAQRPQTSIENPEINRHLRDLLQRQQFKKLDDSSLLPGKQRVWPPNEGNQSEGQQPQQPQQQQQQQQQQQSQFESSSPQGSSDVTFRHPLPPGVVRPRIPVSQNTGLLVRQQPILRLPQADPRMVGIDPRMRLLIQHQQQQRASTPLNVIQQPFQPTQVLQRPQIGIRTAIDPYDQLNMQKQQLPFQQNKEQNIALRIGLNQTVQQTKLPAPNTNAQVNTPTSVSSNVTPAVNSPLPSSTTETQEIPDNVTAELEKLEQENGGMVGVEEVSDILGGLADDDDELLAEMGADFNILEYADPELDALTGGEKTNILDSLDLEESEPDKEVKKEDSKQILSKVPAQPTRNITQTPQAIVHSQVVARPTHSTTASPVKSPPVSVVQPPPLTVSESHATQSAIQLSSHQQQIQQQMQQQVAQAAAMGRPMAPGTRLMSPDGAIGIVTSNNSITVTYPPNFPQRVAQTQLQFQSQRVQLRMGAAGMTRMVSVGPGGSVMHTSHIGLGPQGPRISLPPPPPPPYPGPPPPYPGPTTQEQPLLLEDLLEQEKREQEKQMQTQPQTPAIEQSQPNSANQTLLSDQDYEKLRADVLRTVSLESPPQGLPAQGLLPVTSVPGGTVVRQAFQNQAVVQGQSPQWQQSSPRSATVQSNPAAVETTSRIPTFNAPLMPAPPLPPEHIVTEQDRQTQLHYEQWLNQQNSILTQQLKYYETEVQKLRKIRKSLNSKQRQLKKSGNQLAEPDALELKRISAEQAILQKQLESSRKQSRQHGMLIQEYRNKQQVKQQRPQPGQSPLMMGQQTQSPLGPPASSPIHSTTTPQSPMLSPSESPMMGQHSSPLHSPTPLVCASPGSTSIGGMLQSPSNQANSSMSPLGLQQSPRIGTPHSQGEESPGPVQSPQMCLPPPTPRMTSPQHSRRLVTSPVGYTSDLRSNTQQLSGITQRFIRPSVVVGETVLGMQTPKPRLSLASGFQQVIRTGGPSPLSNPQTTQQQTILTPQQHQQMLRQQQLQQQALVLQQQQQQNPEANQQTEGGNMSQRTLQMIQQRQLIIQQHQQLAQQRQQMLMQQQVQQQVTLTPQQIQHQQLLQQQQLIKQQQIVQMQQSQGGKSPMQQPPSSPMPPRSPMIQGQSQQMMSPHHAPHQQQPQSPMPPKSPLVQLGYGNPSPSPMPRSPMIHQSVVNQPGSSPATIIQQQINQHHGNIPTPSSPISRSPILSQMPSPMNIRRPPSTSSSPVVPDRPQSVENPSTPRTPFTPQSTSEHDTSGGGNPHNPNNPIPACPGFGRFGYFKLGLRGGSPMWSFGRGSKRPPTLPPNLDNDKATSSELGGAKIKKESHINKVSILKKKPAIKVPPTQAIPATKVASLVCADYNEFDDSSSTPPVTPPPISTATSTINKKVISQKANNENLIDDHVDSEHVMIIDSSPEEKHIQCEALVDYDYDNDKTLVTTEVSLSSVAQQVDSDDIAVIETFTQGELGDVISSPLESEVTEEYVLFPTDMVVDLVDTHENLEDQDFHEKEGEEEDEYNNMIIDGKKVEIVAIQSPTSSDEELIKSGKTREVTSENFRLNLMPGLRTSESQVRTITDTPESPDQEEMNVDPPSPEPFVSTSEDFITSLGDSEIVIIDPSIKSPEEINIATTKEDFEELIDGEKRDEKLHLSESSVAKQLAEIHKYAVCDFSGKSSPQNFHWSVGSPTYTSSTVSDTHISSMELKNASISSPMLSPIQSVIQTKSNKIEGQTSRITAVSSVIAENTGNVPIFVASSNEKINSAVQSIVTAASSSTINNISSSKVIDQKLNVESPKTKVKYVNKIESTSPSLSLNTQVASLPNKIFEDECTSPDESICQDDPYSPIRKAFVSEPFKKSESTTKANSDSTTECELKTSESEMKTTITKSLLESAFKMDDPKKLYNLKSTPNNVSNNANKIMESVNSSETVVQKSSEVIKETMPQNLSMTDSVNQEKCSIGNICVAQRDGKIETMPASFITHSDLGDNNTDLDSKSVVISIPSPTPSQEQMLDNIAMQELETRRRDGKGLPTEFDSIEDVLNMIENITGEQANIIESKGDEQTKDEKTKVALLTKSLMDHDLDHLSPTADEKAEKINEIKNQLTDNHSIMVSTASKSTTVPQLSPLSPATELTTNMANVSQQLRTLLSSLHTSTVTTSSTVESVSKSSIDKEHLISNITNIPSTVNSVMTSRIIQQTERLSPQVTSTVVKKNISVPAASSSNSVKDNVLRQPPVTQVLYNAPASLIVSSVTLTQPPSVISSALTGIITTSRTSSSSGIQLMPDHPKLPLITTIVASHSTNNSVPSHLSLLTSSQMHNTQQNQTSVIVTTVGSSFLTSPVSVRKSAPSLNAMLQSHPAATVPQSIPGTITAASLLGTSRTGFIPSSTQTNLVATPFSAIRNSTSSLVNSSMTTPSSTPASASNITTKTIISTTNLLHTQLTKAPLKRSKSIDDPSSVAQSHFIKKEEVMRSESLDDTSHVSSTGTGVKQELGGCKYSNMQTPLRTEDSQNVLLKQLLQNTGCASTQAASSNVSLHTTTTSLPIVPSLEAQLARPVPPTPTTLLPPLIQNDTSSQLPKTTRHSTIMSRETSFVSRPPQKSPTSVVTNQQLHIDIKKCGLPSRTPSRDELLSPPTPRSTTSGGGSQESSLQTPPLIIKKEATTTVPYTSPISQVCPQEVKKELIDESSQHSEVSDMSRSDIQTKEESMDAMDSISDKMAQDQAASDLKKKEKRRHYQQKRRLNQMMSKEATAQPKKRPRKSSKVEEDYDTFIENLMVQLRQLPPMTVTEPVLNRNFAVCPVFGSGDLSKIASKGYDTRFGDLVGEYGNAVVPGSSDYYSTKPYGDNDPLPEKTPPSTQRLFYDQEFPPIKFDIDDDRKLELFSRDNETPDSIVSASSPECGTVDSPIQFPGLRLIDEDEDSDNSKKRMSPVIPIITPIPIRLKPSGPYLKDYADVDKENFGVKDHFSIKSKFVKIPSNPLKDSGNVTVTLTLTSAAAEDIMGVLRDLANILHIPAPTSYQIVERTSTPPSHKLGLYRTKGKDGKEGAPIDIQSILNGAAKFCRHCDVVILNNLIRKRVSELPFLAKEPELLGDGDELYFCSSTCYMQFALMHRSPTLTQDKAAAIVDHLCQDKTMLKKKQFGDKTNDILEKCGTTDDIEKMDVDEIVNSIKQECIEEIIINENKQKGLNNKFSESNLRTELSDNLCLSPKKTLKHHGDELSLIQPPIKQVKSIQYRHWGPGALQPRNRYKRPTDKEIMETMFRMGVTVLPSKIPEDTRKCMFCSMTGDGVADGPARLLNFDVDKWVHLNCALWSEGVYETVNGALMNLENALSQSLITTCIHCQKFGATIHCFKNRCTNVYHLGCAVKDNCVFYKDKTIHCTDHVLKTEKDNELTTLSVSRRVYVHRDENRQVAAVMHQSDHNHLLRVGSLIFLNVGQLLPHQLQNFHTANYIYPIGYKIIRFYWSMRRINKRCRYVCSIHDMFGRPEFRVLVQEPTQEDVEYRDNSPKAVWNRVLEPLATLRREHNCVQLYPQYVTGEDLFGLTEPAVVRVLESLPGIETLSDYRFKYGRNPLLELPLAINPSGAARSEPKLRNQFPWKRPHTQRTGSSARPVFVSSATGAGEAACPYSKQFVHSKSSQYKKMKQEWRNNVYLARSKIQGLGLYAARDLEKHTMVIEYIGEIIRTELAETREKKYEAKNRGIYMFRLDEERVVDATLCGGLARYINHSCNPNCVAEIVEVDRDLRIIIFAKRRIARGEELAYDYKFDIEDDQHKISCMCGAPNCRKWMN